MDFLVKEDNVNNFRSCARHESGHKTMKKTMIAISVALMSICVITLTSVNEAQATENTEEMLGAGDGHCTRCGLSNGHYRCPAFSPISGARPTDCKCGHSKSSHTYRR